MSALLRLFAWMSALLGLALAQPPKGLVLPFAGPGGQGAAHALAEGLRVAPPSLAALLLPDLPWRDGYDLASGRIESLGGARLAREVSGADWLAVGEVGQDGWVTIYLSTPQESRRARFSRLELAQRWLEAKLGLFPHPFPGLAHGLEATYQRMSQGELSVITDAALRGLYAAALETRQGRAPTPDLAALLPKPLLDFWTNLAQRRLSPAYQALADLGAGRQAQALEAARKLADGLAYERLTALLIQRSAGQGDWHQTARKLAQIAPELPIAWEEVSFAAFDEGQPGEARDALLKALALLPQKPLYWTNLGWAYYLTGDRARSIQASRRALTLGESSPTPAYNLGLVKALYGDVYGAKQAYDQALQRDDEQEFEAALEDLAKAKNPLLTYWQGYLAERGGEVAQARAFYQRFAEANPQHPLAPAARRASRIQLELRISLEKLALQPAGPDAQPFRAGEAVFPIVRLEGSPYLMRAPLVTRLLDENGRVLLEQRKEIAFRPMTAERIEAAPAVTLPREGRYYLEVLYGDQKLSQSVSASPPSLARRLYVAGLQIRDLNDRPLLSEGEMLGPQGDRLLLERTTAALREVVQFLRDEAKDNPQRQRELQGLSQPLTQGPYAGQSVLELMDRADEQVLRAFFEAAAQNPELIGDSDVVNAFVNWLGQE
ncbi:MULTISPECIES: hypothetical protein [unclassified Meiothermus]|uniref:hypothetical protein n=1 Tax=unclassified Meiothermus TaxID=370471 RepID=UPI001F1F3D44|nr:MULTISPECIES: hypothetical protein [unclassified Meiothermus]